MLGRDQPGRGSSYGVLSTAVHNRFVRLYHCQWRAGNLAYELPPHRPIAPSPINQMAALAENAKFWREPMSLSSRGLLFADRICFTERRSKIDERLNCFSKVPGRASLLLSACGGILAFGSGD
jgi:hypothetical protein